MEYIERDIATDIKSMAECVTKDGLLCPCVWLDDCQWI